VADPEAAAALPGELSGSGGGEKASVWELDFCSRPLLDERGKKVWELLVTDASGSLRYSEYFPNNKINSAELRAALQRLAAAVGAPTTVRFFRAQMQTIINRAVTEWGVTVLPSRRCFAVQAWLAERSATVYPALANYDASAQPLPPFEAGAPAPLPDALRGESWAFVSLTLAEVVAEGERVTRGEAFGSTLSPAAAGVRLPDTALVPGVIVFSKRADALAGWTNGLEIASLTADARSASLFLDTGVSTRWAYASWKPSPQATADAEAWQAAKADAGGLHFLCVSAGQESSVSGFWIAKDA